LFLVAGLIFGGTSIAQAKIINLHAILHPVKEVITKGKGNMTGHYNTNTDTVSWRVLYHNLTSKVIMAHFHGPISKPGQNAGIQVWLTKPPAHPMPVSPIVGSAKISPTQAKELLGGKWYVLIHTQKHPTGEIRGRVLTGS
jgi:hypothetical protein